MSSDVLTFWPPSSGELASFRWRLVGMFLTLGGVVALFASAAFAIVSSLGTGFDIQQHVRDLLPGVGITVVVAPLAAFALATLWIWAIGRDVAKAKATLGALISSSKDAVRVVCRATFLGPEGYRSGFLVITDCRLLRCEAVSKGYRFAELVTRDDVRFARTVRRSVANPLAALLLLTLKLEQGLRLTTLSGEGFDFLVMESFRLDPLCAWLEGQGHEVAFRNDSDLETHRTPTEPRFWTAVNVPGQRLKRLLWIVLCVTLVVCVGVIRTALSG